MKFISHRLDACLTKLAIFFTAFVCVRGGASGQSLTGLQEGWRIQQAALVKDAGQMVSSIAIDTTGWHPASTPETVLAALANDGTYTNIYFGRNLEKIPTAPFAGAWWYRKEFNVSRAQATGNSDLVFEGINYRANIWLNGKQIAATNEIFGAYRISRLEAGGKLKAGKNVLAAEVFPPQPGDYTMGVVDWNPKPPDHNMGLFRPVRLHFYQTVALEDVFVESKIDHDGWRKAQLFIHAGLKNESGQAVETTVKGEIGSVSFSETFTLQAGEKRSVTLAPENHPELKFENAKLWWPWELGEPHLYDLKLTVKTQGRISDTNETRFGIREVSDYISADGYRGYRVNGKSILIRGGGWEDDLLLREDKANLEAQLQYTKAMNLNTVRLEGLWGSSQELYNLADEDGLLIMAGWSCQWESNDALGKKTDNFGGFRSEEDMTLATNYLRDQVLWLRNHPSIYVWVLGSDKSPRPELEARYAALLKTIDPTRPRLMSCGSVVSNLSGPSAVKMTGPYDYVTPNYWYLDKKHGGAFGFNTETGPGPQPPPLESLERMIPAGHLWPVDDVWNYHCARGSFGQMNRYLNALTNRYGPIAGAEEFAFKSQAANYEAIRPMYEAFAANLPHTTGVIQWMLNPAWPKLYWQLYDYYLVPGGAFFGAKKGASPTAVIYNYGDQGVYLINQTGQTRSNLRAVISIYDLNSKVVLATNAVLQDLKYGSRKVLDLSDFAAATPVYFVDLQLRDAAGKNLADNFYWLSTKPDVLDEARSEWFVTPNKSFADFTALNRLPEATVRADVSFRTGARFGAGKRGAEAEVTLTNDSDNLAFFIEMKITGSKSRQILTPVFWDDNYISLPPHAARTFHAQFPGGEPPELKLRGWNVKFEKSSR